MDLSHQVSLSPIASSDLQDHGVARSLAASVSLEKMLNGALVPAFTLPGLSRPVQAQF